MVPKVAQVSFGAENGLGTNINPVGLGTATRKGTLQKKPENTRGSLGPLETPDPLA